MIVKSKTKKGGKAINILQTSEEWLPFDRILEDGIIVNNKSYLKILKVFPINYDLKSKLEKEAILDSYKLFLKACDFNLQILIQSKKEDFNSYIFQINKNLENEKNEKLEQISKGYIEYIKEQNLNKNSSSKNFFIIISSERAIEGETFNMSQIRDYLNNCQNTVREYLSRCGNIVEEVGTKKDVEKLMYNFYNFRKSLKFL